VTTLKSDSAIADTVVSDDRTDGGLIPHRLRGAVAGTTRYRREGRGAPLLLLHGLGMNGSVWAPQVEALRGSYDVVTFDMLGHGGTSLPPRDATLTDYADQVLSVMDALGIESAHLAGHSMGALISLEVALTHPQRVRSVAPLNGIYGRTPEQRAAALQRAAMLAMATAPTDPTDTLRRWFGEPVPPQWRPAADTARALLESVNPQGYAITYRLFAESDSRHRGRLQTLRMPALYMTGEFDPHSTPEMSRAMAEETPSGRCEIIAGERHMMTLTAPALIAARLQVFHADIAEMKPN